MIFFLCLVFTTVHLLCYLAGYRLKPPTKEDRHLGSPGHWL